VVPAVEGNVFEVKPLVNFAQTAAVGHEAASAPTVKHWWHRLLGSPAPNQALLPEPKKATAALSTAPVPEALTESVATLGPALKETFAVVPMSNQPKALFIKANINNLSLGHFVLDTGATYMSISKDMAEELGLDLKHTAKVPITTANGTIEVPKVILRSVKVNGLEAKNVEATVMDFKSSSSFSGLLGLSFINRFRLTLDPGKGQMVFEPIASVI
jgi:clan AA aspartic protease (TIGR02281 family)